MTPLACTRLAFCLLAATFGLQAGGAAAQTAIAVGGALKFDNDAVWRRIVDEAGGPGARFAVFATAAGNPERSAGQIIEALTRHGAQADHIPVAPMLKGVDLPATLNDPALIAKVRAAQAVYFSGGAQALIVDTLRPGGRPTEMLQAIQAVFERGGVVAGTSAGAAIMSHTMFRDAPDTLRVLEGHLREGLEVDQGLGFVGPDLLIDQHFLRRGRVGRMLPLMQAKGYRWGLGVEENSAAIIRAGEIEVIGARGALLVDLGRASHDERLPAFNLRGALLSYLERGDRHDLKTGLSTPAAQKLRHPVIDPNLPGFVPTRAPVPFYPDMLADGVIVDAMLTLLGSAATETRGLAVRADPSPDERRPRLGFEFRLYKGADTRGWLSDDAAGAVQATVLRMRLDVVPVPIKAADPGARRP